MKNEQALKSIRNMQFRKAKHSSIFKTDFVRCARHTERQRGQKQIRFEVSDLMDYSHEEYIETEKRIQEWSNELLQSFFDEMARLDEIRQSYDDFLFEEDLNRREEEYSNEKNWYDPDWYNTYDPLW